MKTKSYHQTNLGFFSPKHLSDNQGYITYHDSPRYAKATDEQLEIWSESKISAVRAAALTEQCERKLQEWRENNG